ncbi:MAG: bifunctional diaminohydroxyphosphoribosylaminopyrimidine [Actinomycetota bacterium]
MLKPTAVEIEHMRELAHDVLNAPVRPTPNPRVGCRIIGADGALIAQGIHAVAGSQHAEVLALVAAGESARGGTAIVSLEPCNHFGKTPPCVDALIAAGVARVVFGSGDPNPDAAGGAEKLAAAGIEVVGYVLDSLTDPIIEPWWFSKNHKRPFVTLKIAATMDGFVAARDGSSRWITGEMARIQVHQLRARVDAVAVGSATAVTDDPMLDVRLEGEWPQPAHYVIGTRVLPPLRMKDMKQISTHDPAVALEQMYADGVRHVMVEGGATLASAFIRAGLVDQLLWFTAPKLLGAGVDAIADLGITNINDAVEWNLLKVEQFGQDVMLDLRPRSRAD